MTNQSKGQRNLILMTGTPLTTPEDVYGFTRFYNPKAYPTRGFFDARHIGSRDMFERVQSWKDLDHLHENFMHNCARSFRREIDKDLPEVSYEPIFYELAPEHYAKYKQIAEHAMLEIDQGDSVDFLTQSALQNALQQVIIGYEHYFETEAERQRARKQVAALELLDEVMSSLGERKLIVFAYYQKAIQTLLSHGAAYNAVAVNGQLTAKQREQNLERFVSDPSCRLLIGQPLSMGSGLDTLKDVCHEVLFLELPMVAKDFIQAVGRIDRNGQTQRCRVMVAVAEGTVQVRRQKTLLDKDSLANRVQNPSTAMTKSDLRDWIYGN